MRNLNRIIFINSANIPYADDIYLDGNVHFIGTQGVGKSTVLRAILFFYNADTQKLGIPVEKQTYTEYYFPYANSYIIYEVTTEHGAFCILSFKSMNRVNYRFIDSPYRKEFFIDEETRTAYSGNDRIRAVLDECGTDYSRIIYTFDEYRNILYGNGVSPDLQKYSLMESRQYQNIPRTIQNVLLNSKLDAEFIKKTIISSLNEEEGGIDLNSYKEHLKSFETRLHDIEEFQRKETRKQAADITSLSAQVGRHQTALVQGCRELAAAFAHAETVLPQSVGRRQQAEEQRKALTGRRQALQEASRQRCERLQERLAILNNDLQKARAKADEYSGRHVEKLMERAAKKEEWEQRRQGLMEEQRILTSQYTEISTKYKSLIQHLDEQAVSLHAAKVQRLETLNADYNQRLEAARYRHEAATEALYQSYERLSGELHPARSQQQTALTALDYQLKLCRQEVFFETEQTAIKQRIQAYTSVHLNKKNQMEQARLNIKEITLQWEQEQQQEMKAIEDALHRLAQEQQALRPRIDELETFLQNSRNTLQGWLKEHLPGWEHNIGRICDESILWQTNLSPKKSTGGEASFYGVDIDLDGIQRHIKSIDDYQREKEESLGRVEQIRQESLRLQEEKEALQNRLRSKYQPRIREQKERVRIQQYELEKLEAQYQTDMLDLEVWKKKEEEERRRKTEGLEAQRLQARQELESIDRQLENLNAEKSGKLAALKQEWQAEQRQMADEQQAQTAAIRREDKEELRRIASEKNTYEADMQKELHSQGADTERLQNIADQMMRIDRELQSIKEHATLLIEYQKDKRDLMDNIPQWQREADEQQRLLGAEHAALKESTARLQTEIDATDKELAAADEQVRSLQLNMDAFHRISAYDWYRPHQDLFLPENRVSTPEVLSQKSCIELIEELGRLQNQYLQLQSRLRKEVNLFTGHFGEDNTFKFATKFNEDWEYVRFADELHDFVEENRIDEYIRRINDEHSDIFKRISMDTAQLTASETDIHDLINQVNKGFHTCNFVGVIQRIEMKVEESSNRVVNCLRAIRHYYNEHAYDLTPGTNLFSSENTQPVKQEAIGLLRDFIKEIHAYRYDNIRLYDSFELRFRIIENDNDTGFVERLSNVGSEGTDILVKAMINIMLINVFKEGASQKFKDFKLHCMMDEIGKLHPNNVNGILKFANDRNIILINGSPTELNRDAYKHVYLMTKGAQSKTRIARLISDSRL